VPPKPWYKNASIITPVIFGIILGLMSIVWNGMAADLKHAEEQIEEIQKEKATNADVKEALHELKTQTKEQNDAIQQNQLAIKELLIRQEIEKKAPVNLRIKGKSDGEPTTTPVVKREAKTVIVEKEKKVLSPEQFGKYLSLKPEIKVKYKAYLEKRGYDVSDLPEE
jgi:hypothetical protein